MKLDNKIISIDVADHGAELKSAVKDGREYMWCADEKYWGRTSPVLFPIVGRLIDNTCRIDGKTYTLTSHGFARDCDFKIVECADDFVTYLLESDENTLEKYPFNFRLYIKYALINNIIKIEWTVENTNEKVMSFSIGGHPAFNLKPGDNYFGFDTDKDLVSSCVTETGFYDKYNTYTVENDGHVKIVNSMFDNDALIIENNQVKEVSLCDADKKAYVKVRFDAELFGLWSPTKKNAPFVCIEPWYGIGDRFDFKGEFSEKDYIINLKPTEVFNAGYEIELL